MTSFSWGTQYGLFGSDASFCHGDTLLRWKQVSADYRPGPRPLLRNETLSKLVSTALNLSPSYVGKDLR